MSYHHIGPITIGRDTDIDEHYHRLAFVYLRVSKFQIVYEWRPGWKELSFAWG